jgi:sRNA-binding regulator protein Hfq
MEMFTKANIDDFDDHLHNELRHEKVVTLVHFKNSHVLTCRVNKFCDQCGNIRT